MRIIEPFRKIQKSDIILLNVLAAVVGALCGYIAIGFRFLISFFRELFMYKELKLVTEAGSPSNSPYELLIIFAPAVGGLMVGLLTYYLAREAKGHGVPEVMAAVVTKGGVIRPRVALIKSLASAITIGSGGSAGREGPIVQIGSASASAIGQIMRFKGNIVRVLVACGAAGGITATFNTPIAGVIFAIELILLEFKTRSFIPLVISSVIATVISRIYLGTSPAFEVPLYSFKNPLELLFYLLLGIIAGLIGILIIRSLYWTEDLFDNLKIPAWIKPAIGGLLLGLLFFKFRYVMGIGYETMHEVLHQNLALEVMVILVFAKILALSLTLGSGGSGGVFAPSLFIGCMLGGAFGSAVHTLFPDITASYGAYAMVGMAAVFAATGRATLTSIIIIFEMTRDYNIILPLMFACVVADAVSFLLQKETIYTEKLARNGIQIFQDMASDYMMGITASDIMSTDLATVTFDTSGTEIARLINKTDHHGFPIVDEKGNLAGIVTDFDIRAARKRRQLNRSIKELPLRELTVAYKDETMNSVVGKMLSKKIAHIPVVERGNPEKIIGLITRTDIMNINKREQ
jgi:CIC family chloride channel protein